MATSYKTYVERTGRRKGHLVCGNGPEMEFGAPPDAHGRKGWLTPEDAYVAAVNTCIHMMFLWVAEKLKIDLLNYCCEAEGFKKVYLDKTEEFTHVVLRPKITVHQGDADKIDRALEITTKYSLIAASITADLIIEPEVLIEPVSSS